MSHTNHAVLGHCFWSLEHQYFPQFQAFLLHAEQYLNSMKAQSSIPLHTLMHAFQRHELCNCKPQKK